MKRFTNAQKAWLAGVIDCEGAISMIKRGAQGGWHGKPHGKTSQYRFTVSVTNTDYRLMRYLKNMTGEGCISSRGHRNPNARRGWNWTISSLACEQLLPQLLPWFVLKRKQAELLLKAIAITRQLTPAKGSGRKDRTTHPKLWSRRDSLRDQITILNMRGSPEFRSKMAKSRGIIL